VEPISKTCILKRLLIDTSKCKCPSSFFQTTSLNTTICGRKLSMAMYTWRFDAACTVYHKPAYWQTSSYDITWVSMATSKYNTHPVFGSTFHAPSGSICALMTLESSTMAMKISNTSLLHYALRRMKLLRIALAIYTEASILRGTTSNDG
jgi:hypothetical protein